MSEASWSDLLCSFQLGDAMSLSYRVCLSESWNWGASSYFRNILVVTQSQTVAVAFILWFGWDEAYKTTCLLPPPGSHHLVTVTFQVQKYCEWFALTLQLSGEGPGGDHSKKECALLLQNVGTLSSTGKVTVFSSLKKERTLILCLDRTFETGTIPGNLKILEVSCSL